MHHIAIPLALLLALSSAVAQTPCCEARSVPGCTDAGCSAEVCQRDPYCCATAWDERCAGEASVLCSACRPASTCTPPDPTQFETESCGATVGDACPGPLDAVPSLPLGVVARGTVWASDAGRDVDWYQVTLASAGNLTVECWSSGPVGAAIVDATCPPTVHAEGTDGCPSRCSACLPAGTYRIAVRSLLFENLACGDARGVYTLRATVTPCAPGMPLNDRCEFAEPVSEGPIAFDSREASTDPAWLPAVCDEGAGLAFTHDVWFSFTAPATAVYRIGTCDAPGFDARVALYDSCGGTTLACSDDACVGGAALVEAGIPCGTHVLIRLGGWGHGATGTLRIEAIDPDACACEADLDGNGLVDAGDVALILLSFGDPGGPADLDHDLEVGPGDIAIALLSTGPCAP